MKKPAFILSLILAGNLTLNAQTLFTYGPHKASAKEFLRAFEKNNQPDASKRKQAMKDYLDLYVNARLKIQEAYDRGYDTLPMLRSEMANLRGQIIEPYLTDPTAIDRFRSEAFARSQKDIHAAHIFIGFTNTDTTAARKKLEEVQKRLAKGEDFQALAAQFSDDPSAKQNRGDLNYITVFTLPYTFENIIYSLRPGQVSTPYRSRAGYHLFKNLGERKALGKIRIEQVMLALPPNAGEADIKTKQRLADSLYQALQKGSSMAVLAAQYSNDLVSANANGRVPDITVGQYSADFEKFIADLQPGELGKPIKTEHGFHIVKKIESVPIVADSNNVENNEWLEQKILADDRWKTARDFIYARVKEKPGLKMAAVSQEALWGITDSLLDYRPAGAGRSLTLESTVFTIGNDKATVQQWIDYAYMNRYRNPNGGMASYDQMLEDFQKQKLYDYYRNHLEDYNEAFRIQMDEFRDGNLFFEIMQQEVWNRAQTDTAQLRSLYQKNKNKYVWENSATALLFFCSDSATAATLAGQLKGNTGRWREITEPYRDRVVVDSARYEWSQLPGLDGKTPVAGQTTPFVSTPGDMTTSFAIVLNVFDKPEPRSFEEARGLVMNDYQSQLEEEWIKKLKKKYPVKVDYKVLEKL